MARLEERRAAHVEQDEIGPLALGVVNVPAIRFEGELGSEMGLGLGGGGGGIWVTALGMVILLRVRPRSSAFQAFRRVAGLPLMLKITPSPGSSTPPIPAEASARLTGPLVVVLAYDGLCTFEFAIAAEIFGLARPEMGAGWYRFATAAIESGPLRAHGGLRVEVDGSLDLLDQASLVVIPGWKGSAVPVPDRLRDALLAAHARGTRLASICSGAFVLAATGCSTASGPRRTGATPPP